MTEEADILLRCRAAAELIYAGHYEAAGEALGEFWRGPGKRPDVRGLAESAAAEVLLQAGALSGWVGASRQAAGSQEAAKDLISESAALFERLGETDKAASARAELAVCYWREGAYDEARVLLHGALARVGDEELTAKITLRLAVIESSSGYYFNTFRLLTDSAPLFERCQSHAVRGRFHNELAIALRRLGAAEHRGDYFDRAIIEYTAAIYHYEQAGYERYQAANENNLAFLLHKLGRHGQAHEHLDRARATLLRLNDLGLLAQVDETRARVLAAEDRYVEARRVIGRAVGTLEAGGAAALLADALTTEGVVLARLGEAEASIASLRRAVEVAEQAGALSNAGLAALALIEEHGAQPALSQEELYGLYRRADELLKDSQDAEDLTRLRACARVVMGRLAGLRPRGEDFSFFSAVREFEAKIIEQALEESRGSVTKAARLLGLTHQTLGTMLIQRHSHLAGKRTPRERRRRSLIKRPKG